MSAPTRICVFCGSSAGVRPAYSDVARAVSVEIVRRGMGIVYGGASIGLMGVVADAALAAGGEVIGVMPQLLVDKEVAHKGLTTFEVVASMHARKKRMADLSDAFLALPGGTGTLDEIFEMQTWSQLKLQQKPCGFLNVDGYYDSLVAFLDHAAGEGFMSRSSRERLLFSTDAAGLLDRLLPGRG